MKVSELRLKTVDELQTELKNLHKEQFNYRFIKAAKEAVKPHLVRACRLTIARIKTILKEKKVEEGKNA